MCLIFCKQQKLGQFFSCLGKVRLIPLDKFKKKKNSCEQRFWTSLNALLLLSLLKIYLRTVCLRLVIRKGISCQSGVDDGSLECGESVKRETCCSAQKSKVIPFRERYLKWQSFYRFFSFWPRLKHHWEKDLKVFFQKKKLGYVYISRCKR